MKTKGIIIALLILASCKPTQIIFTHDSTSATSDLIGKPVNFPVIGIDANISYIALNYSSQEFRDSIKFLGIQSINYPGGGDIANFFNWHIGIAPGISGDNPNLIADLAMLIKESNIKVFITLAPVRGVNDQIEMVDSLIRCGVKSSLISVRLGNEVNNPNGIHYMFPTAYAYRDTLKKWIPAFKARWPDMQFGAVGENHNRKENWNAIVMQANPDYLVTDVYPNPVRWTEPSGVINFPALQNTLDSDFRTNGMDKYPKFWVGEYGSKYGDKDTTIALRDDQKFLFYQFITNYLINRGAKSLSFHGLVGKGGDVGALDVPNKKTITVTTWGNALQKYLNNQIIPVQQMK